MSELVPLPDADLARAAGYARAALAPATLAAYAADWADFCAWCGAKGVASLPAAPVTVAGYLAALATTHAGATLRRRVAAIGRAQTMAGHPWSATHPAIRDTLAGIARQHGMPPAPRRGDRHRRDPQAGRHLPRRDHRHRATAPSCCSASPPRCGEASWSGCSAST